MHLGKGQFVGTSRHHPAKHFLNKILFDRHGFRFTQDVQPPKGKEQGRLLSQRGKTISDDESGDGFVQVAREHHHGQVFACSWGGQLR